jgi:predicted metal-dependent phosphoesterase TrpH
MGLADLHIHSVYSYDGTAPVASILNRAQEVGLNVIAITDHDEIKGSLKAFDLAPRFVTEKIEPNLSLIGTILKVGEALGSVSHRIQWHGAWA